MEDHSEYVIDKSKWGEGPWQQEPDKLNWIDADTNLDCMIVRNHMGALCGYVAVDENHPAFGLGYDDVGASAHGGLTYANECFGHICHIPEAGRPDNVWWFGFDCAHAGDQIPQFVEIYAELGRPVPAHHRNEQYRDLNYVKQECADLAAQLHQLTHEHPRQAPVSRQRITYPQTRRRRIRLVFTPASGSGRRKK